jgi:hypothetical protein
MRILASAVVATSILGAATAAFAADTTGVVKSIDMKKDMFTLSNGMTYDAAKGVDLANVKIGERVAVTYAQQGKAMDATLVKPAT